MSEYPLPDAFPPDPDPPFSKKTPIGIGPGFTIPHNQPEYNSNANNHPAPVCNIANTAARPPVSANSDTADYVERLNKPVGIEVTKVNLSKHGPKGKINRTTLIIDPVKKEIKWKKRTLPALFGCHRIPLQEIRRFWIYNDAYLIEAYVPTATKYSMTGSRPEGTEVYNIYKFVVDPRDSHKFNFDMMVENYFFRNQSPPYKHVVKKHRTPYGEDPDWVRDPYRVKFKPQPDSLFRPRGGRITRKRRRSRRRKRILSKKNKYSRKNKIRKRTKRSKRSKRNRRRRK